MRPAEWALVALAALAVVILCGANGNPWPFACRDARPNPTCRVDAELIVDGCVPICRCLVHVDEPPEPDVADGGP